MGTRNTTAFSALENELAELAKALGHPARIAILRELARRNTCVCGEIVDVIPLAQSTVSQHLKELKAAGLITGTVEGVKSCYCINWAAVDRLRELLNLCCAPENKDCTC